MCYANYILSYNCLSHLCLKIYLMYHYQAGSFDVREVKQFHFTAWPDHGVPSNPTNLLTFVRKVKAYEPPGKYLFVVSYYYFLCILFHTVMLYRGGSVQKYPFQWWYGGPFYEKKSQQYHGTIYFGKSPISTPDFQNFIF